MATVGPEGRAEFERRVGAHEAARRSAWEGGTRSYDSLRPEALAIGGVVWARPEGDMPAPGGVVLDWRDRDGIEVQAAEVSPRFGRFLVIRRWIAADQLAEIHEADPVRVARFMRRLAATLCDHGVKPERDWGRWDTRTLADLRRLEAFVRTGVPEYVEGA